MGLPNAVIMVRLYKGACKIACRENTRSLRRKMYNGYETWKLDTRRCASFNFTNKNGTMCNTCVKSCPWSNPSTFPHDLVRSLVINIPVTRRNAIRAAETLGTRMSAPEEKWWFDMEYIDDVIQLRKQAKNNKG